MLYTIVTPSTTLSLDCTLKFDESYISTASSHIVETGSPITDHVYLSNPKFVLCGVVSDYNVYNPAKAGITEWEGSLTPTTTASFDSNGVLVTDGPIQLSASSLAKTILKSIWKNRQLVYIAAGSSSDPREDVTSYTDCVIVDLKFTETPDGGEGALYPTIAFEQLTFTSTKTTQDVKETVPAYLIADATAQGDIGTTEVANDPTTSKKKPEDVGYKKEIDIVNTKTDSNIHDMNDLKKTLAALQKSKT